eukprot:TRINITY_DN11090_c0_g1_i1.p1 TRINITY_DN11090_c0_g1~~TRINITY_DN11090_c0_g1_i1.p1  ORF type:complete len:508 (-),score=108.52 TRINITY_DN11090_c0_g1_i1:149-1672(-)
MPSLEEIPHPADVIGHNCIGFDLKPEDYLASAATSPMAGAASGGADREDGPAKPHRELDKVLADAQMDMLCGMSESSEKLSFVTPTEAAKAPVSNFLRNMVASAAFEGVFTFVLISNSIFIGIQANYVITHPSQDFPDSIKIGSHVYAGIFFIELCIRFAAAGPRRFFTSRRDVMWNLLDLFCVSVSIVEIFLEILYTVSDDAADSQSMESVRILRILRVSRLFRTLRVARLIRFVRALRTLVYSIVCTLKTVFWAMILLLLIIYVFGLLFVQALADHKEAIGLENHDQLGDDLIMFWGSLPDAMITLYKTIAGGLSWHDAVYPLREVGFIWVSLFLVYTAFTILAVMNVITGVFCESAIESAKQDQEAVIQQRLQNKKAYTEKLKLLFNTIDDDGSNQITVEEFFEYFENEQAQAFFEYMGIEIADAREVINLVDQDGSGSVDIEEFVVGCLRLRGPARAIDVAQVQYDSRGLQRAIDKLGYLLERHLGVSEPAEVDMSHCFVNPA